MESSYKIKGVLTIIGTVLVTLIQGSLYMWANINTYFMSYLRENGNPSIQLVDGYFMMPIIATVGMLSGIIGPKITQTIGLKKCLLISFILIWISHLLILYFTKLTIVYFSMVLFGVGNGIGLLSLLGNCWMIFPERKGLVSGIVLFGLGTSASIFTWIADAIINPGYVKVDITTGFFPKEISQKTYDFIRILNIIVGIQSIVAFFLIFDQTKLPKTNIKKSKNDEDIYISSGSSYKEEKEKEISNPTTQAYTHNQIWFIIILNFCTIYYCFLCMNTYRSFGQLSLINESVLSLLSKISPLVNGIGRIMWGSLADLFPFKYLYALLITCNMVLSVGIYYAAAYPIAYFITVCLTSFLQSGCVCVLVPLYPRIYDIKYAPQIYSIAVALAGMNSLFSSIMAKIIVHQKEDYKLLYATGTVLSAISLIICLIFKDSKFHYEETANEKNKELIDKA